MALWDLFLAHRGRKIHKWIHYFPIYERHFAHFVNRDITILEIGVGLGGSLELWRKYFGPQARVVGIDHNPDCASYQTYDIAVRIGSQSDVAFLGKVVEEFGIPNIVIDDGSHKAGDLIATYEFLYPKMPRNSIYLLEDLHTSYYPEFDGGYKKPCTFVEYAKEFIDRLNARYTKGLLPPDEFGESTFGMYCYDSIIVFEKMEKRPHQTLLIGNDVA
jgi:hypothetical protein